MLFFLARSALLIGANGERRTLGPLHPLRTPDDPRRPLERSLRGQLLLRGHLQLPHAALGEGLAGVEGGAGVLGGDLLAVVLLPVARHGTRDGLGTI